MSICVEKPVGIPINVIGSSVWGAIDLSGDGGVDYICSEWAVIVSIHA